MNRKRNLDQLRLAAMELGPLRERVVFLGGCTTGLFITDTTTAEIRATKDVDVIVEVAGRAEFYALEQQLRELGFQQPMDDEAPICRWQKGLTLVDVMPTDPAILGFGNRWYPTAIRIAEKRDLGNGLGIRIVTPAMFAATKIEAFEGRGKGDFYSSQDIEDLVAVVDGRAELLAELQQAPADIRTYVSEHLARYLASRDFLNALPGFVPGSGVSSSREALVLERLKGISRLQ